MFKKQGFTLIELLVVVLIIGILAAVALPQYNRTVLRSRTSQAVVMLKAITDAQERYYLERGGVYTANISDLDIDVPAGLAVAWGTAADSTRPNVYFFACSASPLGASCSANAYNPLLPAIEFTLKNHPLYKGKHWCVAMGGNATSKVICASMGVVDTTSGISSGSNVYYIIN